MCELKSYDLPSPSPTSSPTKSAQSQTRTEYEFISEITDDISCSICLSVLVQPNLTDCCGNHFCQVCIARVKEDGRPCPLCQEPSFTTMLNKALSRKLNQLDVKCPNTSEGCSWIGEFGKVDKHVQDNCEFFEVLCDFGCGENIIRRYLLEHKSKACKLRPFTCEHCQLLNTWLTITQHHYPVCDKYPVPCPNQCDVGEIERKQLEDHLSICPLQVIDCTFQFVGCKVSLPRREMPQHMSDNMASHLTLGFQTFQQQLSAKDDEIAKLNYTISLLKTKEQTSAKDDEIVKLEYAVALLKTKEQTSAKEMLHLKATSEAQTRKILHLETQFVDQKYGAVAATATGTSQDDHRTYPPCAFTMTNFQCNKILSAQWFSEPFYTHKGGYKMCLSVFANGTGVALDSYVSVFVNLMRGEYDDNLKWPFRGSITVQLDMDDDDIEEKCRFNARAPARAAGRVELGDRKIFGQGVVRFVSLDRIGDDKKFLNFEILGVELNL